MPAYNFSSRFGFAPAVEGGTKTQTIRRRRKRPTRPGDTLYLYTSMRTKACQLLRIEICVNVEPIEIGPWGTVSLIGRELEFRDCVKLAWDDGFKTFWDFYKFFERQYGLPTKGLELIRWK